MYGFPLAGEIGTSGRNAFRGPGFFNIDSSVVKKFKITESQAVTFRAEAYNAFNHTQFSSFDTAARFDPAGRQVSTTFGQFNASRTPRQMQLAVRFTF